MNPCLPSSNMIPDLVDLPPFRRALITRSGKKDPHIVAESLRQRSIFSVVVPAPLRHVDQTHIGLRPGSFAHLKISVLLMEVEIFNLPFGVKPSVRNPPLYRHPFVSERERAELGQLQLDLRHRPGIATPDGRTG